MAPFIVPSICSTQPLRSGQSVSLRRHVRYCVPVNALLHCSTMELSSKMLTPWSVTSCNSLLPLVPDDRSLKIRLNHLRFLIGLAENSLLQPKLQNVIVIRKTCSVAEVLIQNARYPRLIQNTLIYMKIDPIEQIDRLVHACHRTTPMRLGELWLHLRPPDTSRPDPDRSPQGQTQAPYSR